MSEPKHALTPERLSWLTPQVRRWAYNVTLAVLAVLFAYGVITADQSAAWQALALAVVGMARAHTPNGGEK